LPTLNHQNKQIISVKLKTKIIMKTSTITNQKLIIKKNVIVKFENDSMGIESHKQKMITTTGGGGSFF
jgi:hypothetical protein